MSDEPDIQTDETSSEGVADALDAMLRTPGWRIFWQHARQESGPEGYGRAVAQALASIGTGPDRQYEVTAAMDRIHFTADAINRLMAWPVEEIARLSSKKAKPRLFEQFRKVPRA